MITIDQNQIKPIHPFAARMAPEIAFNALDGLLRNATILDPMAGSGTVLKTISSLGYQGIGFDIDPLSVLMTRAWTMTINEKGFLRKVRNIIIRSKSLNPISIQLPWIDNDANTTDFISFWFAKNQIEDLRRLSFFLNQDQSKYTSLLKVMFSKLIIAKNRGASLAADVSHSRPHRVREENDFDVFYEYEKACIRIVKTMNTNPSLGKIKVLLGDARKLKLQDESIDSIITSPPYLNAIDYMRGHKLSLVWLGYKIDELSFIRGASVGAEKAPNENADLSMAKKFTAGIDKLGNLPKRKINMIYRYSLDMNDIIRESKRVLKKGHKATFVIGNTFQNRVFIKNTSIVSAVADFYGLELISSKQREIPQNKRYLPPPTRSETSTFKNRMRTEVVMTFLKN